MKGLITIIVILVLLGVAEALLINRVITLRVQQDMAHSCPVWLMDSPQEGCRGR